ncbi:unnamed protein product [Peniophora sp. CBMAI 1063]|nr:unnamed protein product [Peniophora sp. CBMAI 1063]
MLVVGLTGGISTGKSTVSNLLKQRGVPVIDADILAREVVAPGTPGIRAIVSEFGQEVLREDGNLDRPKLGSIIFNDERKRKKLNAIVHPAVRKAMVWAVLRHWMRGDRACVLDVPLLIESGIWHWVGKVVVVYCSQEIQLRRLQERDGSTREAAQSRVKAQMPITDKLDYADQVLDNSGRPADLEPQVDALFLQKLYEMVNDTTNNDLIRWSDAGDAFLVLDHERFAREVLGRWFKHQNFQSFVRQLNMYGFHKIPSLQQGVLRSDSDTEIWTFEHTHFRRDQPDLLCLISRKKQASQQPANAIENNANVEEVQTPATPATTASAAGGGQVLDLNQIVTGIQAIKRHQQTISADLNDLKASNQALWQEVVAARERHSKQQDMINRILKFLGSVFGRQDHDAKNHGDRVTPSPPLMARHGQRLMIGDVEKPKRQVEVVEVEDEATRSPTTSSKSESEFPTTAHIDTHSVTSPATERTSMLTPATEAPPPSFYVDSNAETPGPWSQAQNPLPSTPTPYPTLDPSQAQIELHRPQPSQPGMYPGGGPSPFPSSLPANTQDMQAAFQTLLNSPTQLQRFMDALNAASVPPPAPPPAPPMPTQSYQQPAQQQQQLNNSAVQAYVPPSSYPPFDFSQFNPEMASALLPTGDDGTAALAGLTDNQQQQMARTWKDAQDINQEVDTINDNIRSLMENMGFDPSTLASPEQPDTISDPSNADFDFDAFLSTFGSNTAPDAGFIDSDPVASSVVPGDGDMSGITAFMDDVAADPAPRAKAQAQAQAAAVDAARKRRSDAAELDAGLRPVVPNGAPPPKKTKA